VRIQGSFSTLRKGSALDARTLTHVLYGLAALGVLWFALRPRTATGRVGTGTIGRETAPLLPIMSVAQPVVTASTLAFLRQREGLKYVPYRDGPGWSIGYGHFLGTNQPPTDMRIALAQAEKWLSEDAQKAASAIKRLVAVPLSQSQFDALVSFVYNIGETDFRNSTLLRKLNSGDAAGAANEFRRWVYQGNTVVAGLMARRSLEKELFLT